MTKNDIVKRLAEDLGLTQVQTREVVQQTFDAIVNVLLQEKRLELRGFGVFTVKQRKARLARNPHTGGTVAVEAKNVVTFKPGAEMKARLAARKGE